MPKKVVEFLTDNDEIILIEVDQPTYSSFRGSRPGLDKEEKNEEEVIKGGKFKKAISTVRYISNEIVGVMKNAELKPDEVEIKLGLKASSATGNLWNFVLVKAEGEGNLEITLKWKSK